jgi:hypothetical protein
MTKMERLKVRHEVKQRRERALIQTIKLLPYVLAGYSLLWLLLAM